MDIGYKRWAYEDSTSEDPMLGFQVSFTSMLCHWERTSRGTGKFRTDFPLIPAENSKKLFDHFADKLSCYFGFDMNVYSVSYLGDALLEPGDRVCFYSNDKSAFFYPSELIWEWDGGLKCTAKSEAVQKSGTSDATVSLQELANTLYTLSTTLQNVRYNSVTTKTLEADSATIGLLKVEQADVKYATIQSLTATEAKITTLDSTTIKTDELYAKVAELDYIKSDHADIANLKSTMITADNLRTEIAKIGYLTADEADIRYLTASTANATFLHADMSDMDIAKIQTLFATAGIVSDMTIKDGHITGVLDSVTVNANSITTGTLSVDRLVIRGSEKSLVYELNNISGALQARSVDTLNGEILTQRTITADKLVAKSITSNEIKAGTITSDEIASGTIKAANINVTDLVGNSAFINSLKSNTVIVGLQNDINGISVGGRNLLCGTKDFSHGTTLISNVVELSGTINGFTILKAKCPSDTYYVDPYQYSIVFEPNTQYTLSFWAKADSRCEFASFFYNIGGSSYKDGFVDDVLETTWKRFVKTWTTDNVSRSANVLPIRLQSSKDIWAYMYGLKFEKGNRATDWTPAPEDVDSLISAAQSTADSANALAGTANSAAGAAQTTANTAVSDIKSLDNISTKSYTFSGSSGTSKWVKLGTLVSREDAKSSVITVYTGNGFNASPTQNSKLEIVIKNSWQSSASASGAFGVSVTTQNWSNPTVKVMASSSDVCDVWIYLPWAYWNGNYTISGYRVSWTHSGANQSEEPTSGTVQNIEVRVNAEQAKSVADSAVSTIGTWCYNNDITYINGGKIYTGTVTADQLAANSITADKLSVDAITSRNYVKDVAGTKISLADGSYDSKYTKINAEGKISCSDISITGADSKLEITRTVDKWTNTVKLDSLGLKLQYAYGDNTPTDVWITHDGLYAQGTELIGWSAQQVPFIANVADVRTSSGASLNTVNSNLAQLSDDKVLKSNRGWYPNGKSLYAVPPGVYSTNPGAMPSSLGGLNTYGTLLVLRESSYQTAIYMSVVGQMAFWAANSNAWSIIKS